MYPEPGTYQSAYDRYERGGPPGYWYPPPYYPPAPYFPPPPWVTQPYPGQAPMQGTGLNNSLIGVLLPIILTLPALKNGTTVAADLLKQLSLLVDPVQVTGNPTAADFNALLSYSKSVKNAVSQAVGNDATVFAALKQGVLL